MNKKFLTVLVLGIATSLALVPATAVAGGNDIAQDPDADATSDEAVSNEVDINMNAFNGGVGAAFTKGGYGGNAQAAAVCQWIIAYNLEVATIAVAEGLGLISDEDSRNFEWPIWALERNGYGPLFDLDIDTVNASAHCNQEVGTFRVIDSSEVGWGAASPMGGALQGLLSSPWYGGGSGSDNDIDQDPDAFADTNDAIENDADIWMSYGTAQSAAVCQWIVGVNVLVSTVSVADAEASIADDDTRSVTNPPVETTNPDLMGEQYSPALIEVDVDHRDSESTCSQKADLIEFILGSAVDRIPTGS